MSMRMWRVAGLTVALVLTGALVGSPVAADGYDDPLFLGWPSYAPAVPGDFTASTERDCPRGGIRCVDNVIREMTRRWEQLACDHDAVFALTYLRTTEEYRRAVSDPEFFEDNAFVNHEDAVFADYYFDPYDGWHRDRVGGVPPAWRIAFHAADHREVTGTGNMLLGINAHINSDLPFVLHAIGLTRPDGGSRKPDHDKVNVILNRVAGGSLQRELAQRYDPTIDDGDVPGTSLDATAAMQLIQAWREEAWRKAELLRDATSPAEKLRVAMLIERDAAARALVLRRTYRYSLFNGGDSSARDAYCQDRLPQ